MPEFVEAARLKIIECRIAVFWFFLFSVNALCSALMIALANVTWGALDGQGKFMIVVALAWNWTNTIMAFISNSARRIKQTGELFPSTDESPAPAPKI
jgi:hypothetical protein